MAKRNRGFLIPENPPTNSNEFLFGEETANILLTKVRKAAKERGIKVPASITTFGLYGRYFFVSYNSNALRDLIDEVGHEMKLTTTTHKEQYGWS